MERITFEPHPGYRDFQRIDPRAFLQKVEVTARGQVFTEERPYFRGSPSPDPRTEMTDADLIEKFEDNASRTLSAVRIAGACRLITELESVPDMAAVLESLQA